MSVSVQMLCEDTSSLGSAPECSRIGVQCFSLRYALLEKAQSATMELANQSRKHTETVDNPKMPNCDTAGSAPSLITLAYTRPPRTFLALLTFIGLLLTTSPSWAQQRPDARGSEDYPLLSRFNGSRIDKYLQLEFDRYVLPLGPALDNKTLGEQQVLEGSVTKINYQFPEEPKPSLFQLYKSYEQIFEKRDVEVLFSCYQQECRQGGKDLVRTLANTKVLLNGFMGFGEHAFIAARFQAGSQDIYAGVYLKQEKSNVAYELHFVEVESMSLDNITMADIEEGIEETGKKAFYGLYFDTGKSTLTQESESELALLAEYLLAHSDRDYFIVGHTDSVGDYASNRTLATDRAQAVRTALIEQFAIDPSILTAVGVGPVAPVSNNQTATGRAQNRRVELVLR
ncbi:MAG: OmpA family protein [Pseudomonadota bacterium]